MSASTSPVSIHPYFKVRAGHLDEALALLPKFCERSQSEPGLLHYEFSINGDTVFCREAYRDAASTLAHLENVQKFLEQMLAISELTRLEFHGPPSEIEKLRGPTAQFHPQYFEIQCGVSK